MKIKFAFEAVLLFSVYYLYTFNSFSGCGLTLKKVANFEANSVRLKALDQDPILWVRFYSDSGYVRAEKDDGWYIADLNEPDLISIEIGWRDGTICTIPISRGISQGATFEFL